MSLRFLPVPFVRIGLLFAVLLAARSVIAATSAGVIDAGSLWFDTTQQPINAHGGGMLVHGGTYYWYGEIKTGETTLPEVNASWGGTRVPFTGVSCYSSKDLLSWKFEGNVLPADANQRELRSDRVIERPKVIFNAATKKFVMWMHIDSIDYAEARTGVAIADRPEGPFRLLKTFRPNAGVIPLDMDPAMRKTFDAARATGGVEAWGQKYPEWQTWARDFSGGQMARDMSLFQDENGAAYQFYASEENVVMHVSKLSADYTTHVGEYRRITFQKREAPAPFKLNGRYYLATSGCTGWDPNGTELHSAESILGPWEKNGSFFNEDSNAANVSYLSQPCFVVRLENGRFVYAADRWIKDDLESSRYVWMPVEIVGGKPILRFRQTWKLSEVTSTK